MEEKTRKLRSCTGTDVMKTAQDCFACFYSQLNRTMKYAGMDGEQGRQIIRKAASIIERASLDEVPARTSTQMYRILVKEIGRDPYEQVKETCNLRAIERFPSLRCMIREVPDRLEGAVRVAIAGNSIDFGVTDEIDIDESLSEAFRLSLEGYEHFAEELDMATRILYLCDNAGEILFDRVLIEFLKKQGKKVIAAVKGYPVINDATLHDATVAGLHECATIIDNGNDGVGTLLELCSSLFMHEYRNADLIISKGQANYETLYQTRDSRIFFLFKIKCQAMADFLNRRNKDIVLLNGGRSHAPTNLPGPA